MTWYKKLLEKLNHKPSYDVPDSTENPDSGSNTSTLNISKKKSIDEIESGIAPVTKISDINADEMVVLCDVKVSFDVHVHSILHVYCILRDFYSSYGLKVMKHQGHQGGKSEVDVSIKAMIDSVTKEVKDKQLQPMLVLGDSNFTTGKGGSVKCY